MKLGRRMMTKRGAGITSLCINANGGVQNGTNIVDETGKTIGVYGNTKFDFYDGYMAILFDGAGDYLTVPASDDFNFVAGDFTIEVMIRLALAVDSSSRIWNPNGDYYDGLDITLSKSGNNAPVNVNMSSDGFSFGLLSSTPTLVEPGVWTYLAINREGGTAKMALNSSIYTLTTSLGTSSLYYRGLGHSIGGQAGTSRSLYGHIRGYRITKGAALDITTIPTLPFTV